MVLLHLDTDIINGRLELGRHLPPSLLLFTLILTTLLLQLQYQLTTQSLNHGWVAGCGYTCVLTVTALLCLCSSLHRLSNLDLARFTRAYSVWMISRCWVTYSNHTEVSSTSHVYSIRDTLSYPHLITSSCFL